MAIPTSTVGLAISIVNGMIKLGGRVDRVLSEDAAQRGDVAFPAGTIRSATPTLILIGELRKLVAETKDKDPDPLDPDRATIVSLLAGDEPASDQVTFWIKKYRPAVYKVEILDPDAYVKAELERLNGDTFSDEEIAKLAYYVGPGAKGDNPELGWRIALVVVDVLAEFAVDAQQSLIRDPRTRQVVAAVLTRFSEGDLEDEIDSGKSLLRHALSATLNGALDARAAWQGDGEVLDAVLSALIDTRAAAANADDFLIGLVRGRGYRPFVRELLREGGARLGRDDREAYQKILGAVLKQAATVAAGDGDFRELFQDRWTDLARAGLRAFGEHGPDILKDENPILKTALLAAVASLGEPQNRPLLNSAALMGATEAAVAAIAAKPDLIDADNRWARTFFGAFAEIVSKEGLAKTFGKSGLESFARLTIAAIAKQPELIIDEPGLARVVVGGILEKIAAEVSQQGDRRLERLATAALEGALAAIAGNPKLLKTDYADLLAEVSGVLARQVRARSITGIEAEALVKAIAESLAAKPELLGDDATLLRTFAVGLVAVVATKGLRDSFTAAGLNLAARNVIAAVGENPQLIVKSPDLPQKLVGSILSKVATAMPENGNLEIEALATAAVDGALLAVAENPALIEGNYADAVAGVARGLAVYVSQRTLSGVEAKGLIAAAASALADNPDFFIEVQSEIARSILAKIVEQADADPKHLLAGAALVRVADSVLSVVAARGAGLIGADSAAAFAGNIGKVVEQGLVAAAAQLGQRLDIASVPAAISGLVEAWSRGEIAVVSADDPGFRNAFADIAETARRSRELVGRAA